MTQLQQTLSKMNRSLNGKLAKSPDELQGFLDAHLGYVKANNWPADYVRETQSALTKAVNGASYQDLVKA